MLITLLILLLLSNALTLRKDQSILFSRVVILVLIATSYISWNNFFLGPLGKGIGIYGGLFYITTFSQTFNIFIFIIFIISALILTLTAFYARKVSIQHKSWPYSLNALTLRKDKYILFSIIVILGLTLYSYLALNSNFFISFDAPRPWGIYYQDRASPQMEALVELHDNIMFYLLIILFGLAWIIISLIRDYVHEKFPISNKCINHGTLIGLIWTITPALILIFIVFPFFYLLYLMDEVTDNSSTVFVEGHQWYWSYQYPDFLNDDNEELEFDPYLIPESDVHRETKNIWVHLFGNGYGNNLTKYFIHHRVAGSQSILDNLPENMDFSKPVSPLERLSIINHFSQTRLYIEPNAQQISLLEHAYTSMYIPTYSDLESQDCTFSPELFEGIVEFALDRLEFISWLHDIKEKALLYEDNNYFGNIPRSTNSYMGLGYDSFEKKFSFYRSYQCRLARHVGYSLSHDSWKGYPIDFTDKQNMRTANLVDYHINLIELDLWRSVLSCRYPLSQVNRFGLTELLSDKYNILNIHVNPSFYGQDLNMFRLRHVTKDVKLVFDNMENESTLRTMEVMKQSTSPMVDSYIDAIINWLNQT